MGASSTGRLHAIVAWLCAYPVCPTRERSVGCIYAPYKVNPNIFQFYFDILDIFHHSSMHPLFRNIYEFYLIFYDFISSFIIYNNHLYLRRYFLFWFRLVLDLLIHASCPELKSRPWWDHSVSYSRAGYMRVEPRNTCLSSSVLDSHWGGEPSFTFQ